MADKVESVTRSLKDFSFPEDSENEENSDKEYSDEEYSDEEYSDEEYSDKDARALEKTPEQNKGDKVAEGTANNVTRQLFVSDGEWLKEHPWEKKSPDREKSKMKEKVSKAVCYTVAPDWCTKTQINLGKIYSKLPTFIDQMKGPSSRQDLDCVLKAKNLYEAMQLAACNSTTPHVLELVQEKAGVEPKDKRSEREQGVKFKAYSVASKAVMPQIQPSEENYWYLDCEYTLKMHLPADNSWFKLEKSKHIREVNPDKKNERWIFIPSYRRAEIALLDWPEDSKTPVSTIRILVVRPSQFEKYVQRCGKMFPVISLPQDEIGAGYPRYWIQKIALRLKLDFIWMIDDSVECFYEYHPHQKPANNKYEDRRRQFGLVFDRIEMLVKEAQDGEKPIAAMGPRRFRSGYKVAKPFTCLPPRGAVFLSLKALKSKDVYYRPELQHKEDMIFGYECEQNELKVFLDNRIHLQDHVWKDTGAMSPTIQKY